MYKVKQALFGTGATLLSVGALLLALPLLLFVVSALVLTGVFSALWLHFQIRAVKKNQSPRESVVIEGSYSSNG